MKDKIETPLNAGTSKGVVNSKTNTNSLSPKGENTKTLLDTALFYVRQGLSVIPIKPNSKEPLINWKEYQSKAPTEGEVRQWWSENPDANIGIVTGKVSGICVLEIDNKDFIEGREIPVTPTAISGGKGLPHYYFQYKKGIPSFSYCPVGKKELFSYRSDGEYIVAPPSWHSSGDQYTWVQGCALGEVELTEPPEWLFGYMGDAIKPELNKELSYSDEDSDSRKVAKQVKRRIKFSELLNDLGLDGKDCGNYWRFTCPFHPDGEHQDFIVWDDICGAKDFHDGEGYDPIKFLMKLKDWNFKEALNYLKEYTGIDTKNSSEGNIASKIVSLVLDLDVTLFHDETGDAYVRYKQDNHHEIERFESQG